MKIPFRSSILVSALGLLLLVNVACLGGPGGQAVDGEYGPILAPQPTSVFSYWENQVGFNLSVKSDVDFDVAELREERDALQLEYQQALDQHEGELAALLATGNHSFVESSAIQEDAEAGLRAEAEAVNASAEALREQSGLSDTRSAELESENARGADRLYDRGLVAERAAADVAARLARGVELVLPRIRVVEQGKVRERYSVLGRSHTASQEKLLGLNDRASSVEREAGSLEIAAASMEQQREGVERELRELRGRTEACGAALTALIEGMQGIEEEFYAQGDGQAASGTFQRMKSVLLAFPNQCQRAP